MTGEQRLSSQELYEPLAANGVSFFCGVPDSVVGPFSHFLAEDAQDEHVVTANEGNAVGLAIGYHVATGEVPLVYMQNSGLNNALDPLVSLADPSVLRTPMVLLVGWRGQPGKVDEPQHVRQGIITQDLLRTLGIPCTTLDRDSGRVALQVAATVDSARQQSRPHALLIEKDGLAESGHSAGTAFANYEMSRETAVATVVDALPDDTIIVASNGKVSRELFEHREIKQRSHDGDLLVVGGMGHASSIALGVALQKPHEKVVCFDGDGALLMHLGALTTIGSLSPQNYFHVVFNNGSHDSVGGHPTAAGSIDLPRIAEACGYRNATTVETIEGTKKTIQRLRRIAGPALVEVRVRPGARPDLGRPTVSPEANKAAFMSRLARS